MSFFSVTSSELRQKSEQLKGLNAKFKTSVEALETSEQALKTMWEGEANEAFHKAFVNDKGKMDSFYTAVQQYIEALLAIAVKYEEAENKNIATAQTRVCG